MQQEMKAEKDLLLRLFAARAIGRRLQPVAFLQQVANLLPVKNL